MPTQKKIDTVAEFSQKFKDAKSIFLADFSGINVEQTTNLRRTFREAGVEFRVIKNTLAKRSMADAGIEGMDDMLKGVTSFAFSDSDAVSPVKVALEFNKTLKKANKELVLKGCYFEGKVFGPEQMEALSKLPTRDELLSQLLGTLQAPMGKLLAVMQATGQKLVGTLESVKESKA
jgi:large subunit ribosomal protein L10